MHNIQNLESTFLIVLLNSINVDIIHILFKKLYTILKRKKKTGNKCIELFG